MRGVKIDLDQLTPAETKMVFDRYEVMVEALLAANNTLIQKLAAVDGTTNEHVEVLNDWSCFCNALQNAHLLEVEKAASKVH